MPVLSYALLGATCGTGIGLCQAAAEGTAGMVHLLSFALCGAFFSTYKTTEATKER